MNGFVVKNTTVLFAIILALDVSPARSQTPRQIFCATIANYLSNPPQAFISQRGRALESGTWESNLTYPNAACFLHLKSRASTITYDSSCVYNSRGATSYEALDWLSTMEVNTDDCTKRISGAGRQNDFEKTSYDDDDDDGSKTREIRWTAEENGATYVIRISYHESQSHRVYNAMVISYTTTPQ
jgi:hypothetical protein